MLCDFIYGTFCFVKGEDEDSVGLNVSKNDIFINPSNARGKDIKSISFMDLDLVLLCPRPNSLRFLCVNNGVLVTIGVSAVLLNAAFNLLYEWTGLR